MIKLATEKKDQERCFKYLCDKGSIPISDLFFYNEDADGNLMAVTGILVCMGINSKIGMIEPFQQDSTYYAMQLYFYCEGYLKGLGCSYILLTVRPNEEKEKVYTGKLGFKMNTSLNQYFKEI